MIIIGEPAIVTEIVRKEGYDDNGQIEPLTIEILLWSTKSCDIEFTAQLILQWIASEPTWLKYTPTLPLGSSGRAQYRVAFWGYFHIRGARSVHRILSFKVTGRMRPAVDPSSLSLSVTDTLI